MFAIGSWFSLSTFMLFQRTNWAVRLAQQGLYPPAQLTGPYLCLKHLTDNICLFYLFCFLFPEGSDISKSYYQLLCHLYQFFLYRKSRNLILIFKSKAGIMVIKT